MNKLNIVKVSEEYGEKFYICDTVGITTDCDGMERLRIECTSPKENNTRKWWFDCVSEDATEIEYSGKVHNSFIGAYNEMVSYLKGKLKKQPKKIADNTPTQAITDSSSLNYDIGDKHPKQKPTDLQTVVTNRCIEKYASVVQTIKLKRSIYNRAGLSRYDELVPNRVLIEALQGWKLNDILIDLAIHNIPASKVVYPNR